MPVAFALGIFLFGIKPSGSPGATERKHRMYQRGPGLNSDLPGSGNPLDIPVQEERGETPVNVLECH